MSFDIQNRPPTAAFDIKGAQGLKQSLKNNGREGAREIGQQFESLFVGMMIKGMRSTVPQESLFDSDTTRLYNGLLDQQLASDLTSRSNGLGIGKKIEEQLVRQMGLSDKPTVGKPNALSFKGKESTPAVETPPIIEKSPTLPAFLTEALSKSTTSQLPKTNSPAPEQNTRNPLEGTIIHTAADFFAAPASSAAESTVPATPAMSVLNEAQFQALIAQIEGAAKPDTPEEVPAKNSPHPLGEPANTRNLPTASTPFRHIPRAAPFATSAAYANRNRGIAQPTRLPSSIESLSGEAKNFAEMLLPHAEAVSIKTGIPAEFLIAHSALETGWGKSLPGGKQSHNLFGIKAGKGWQGKSVESTTTEYVDGQPVKTVESFRAYRSYREAFEDYAKLLGDQSNYRAVLTAKTGTEFAQRLQQAGYATDPHYANKLSRIIDGMTSKKTFRS